LNEENIDSTKKYILICDVISTGFLTQRLNTRLSQLGTSIEYIAVITSILHPDFKTTESFLKDYNGKIFFLHKYPIAKLIRKDLGKELFSKNIIRINPYTNIPIRLSINETNFNESIIFNTSINYSELKNEITIQNKFLDTISDNSIHVGFYKFNNVIHPYFFNTEKILKEFGHESKMEYIKDRLGHDSAYALDTTKLIDSYFETSNSVEDYLRKTIKFYIDNKETYLGK
jgi:hypothetical protein